MQRASISSSRELSKRLFFSVWSIASARVKDTL